MTSKIVLIAIMMTVSLANAATARMPVEPQPEPPLCYVHPPSPIESRFERVIPVDIDPPTNCVLPKEAY